METNRCDCCFVDGKKWFRYRVGAIIVENGYVLFAGNEGANYLYSVGGGVHMGETAEDAVRREVYEETGINYEIDRLAVIHENFFYDDSEPFKDLDCHEISIYFIMKPRGTTELNSNSFSHGKIEKMYWVPIEDLDKVKVFPTFMKDYLSRPHTAIEHIVTDERTK